MKAVGTGPGDGGSQKIAEKLQAQKGNAAWDVDVAVIHQKMAGDLVREGLLAPYVRRRLDRQAGDLGSVEERARHQRRRAT